MIISRAFTAIKRVSFMFNTIRLSERKTREKSNLNINDTLALPPLEFKSSPLFPTPIRPTGTEGWEPVSLDSKFWGSPVRDDEFD